MRYIQLLDILLDTDSSALNARQLGHGILTVELLVIQGKVAGVIYANGVDIILGNLLSKKKLLRGWLLLMKVIMRGGLLIGIKNPLRTHMFQKTKLKLIRGEDE